MWAYTLEQAIWGKNNVPPYIKRNLNYQPMNNYTESPVELAEAVYEKDPTYAVAMANAILGLSWKPKHCEGEQTELSNSDVS